MFRPSWFYVYIVSCCYSILSLRDGWVMLLVYRIVVATAALTFAGPLLIVLCFCTYLTSRADRCAMLLCHLIVIVFQQRRAKLFRGEIRGERSNSASQTFGMKLLGW